MNGPSTHSEWRTGWPLALAAMFGIFTAVLYVYSTGLFIEPLQAGFGWSRATITGGMMIVGVMAAIGNPLIGLLLDRIGPSRIALFGCLAHASAFALLARAGPGQFGWWLGWICIALASLAISVPVWLVAVVRHFEASRGKALAIGYCGSSLAAIIVPMLTREMIQTFGWREAYLGLAGIALLTGGIAAAILLAFDRRGPVRAIPSSRQKLSPSARTALAGPNFWRIAVMSLLVTLGVIGLTVHFVAICSEKGIGRTEAAGLAGLIGIAGLAGRLLTGALLDRFDARIVGVITFLLPTLACLYLSFGMPDGAGMALVALAVGASLGAELDIMAYLTARCFSLADYGILFGVLTGVVGCAAGFGPLFASILHDLSGSYDNLAAILAAGFIIASILVATVRTPVALRTD